MTAALAARDTGLRTNAAFRRLWLGESVSALGSSVSSVALPLLALVVLHASLVEVGCSVPWRGCRGSWSGCRPARGSTGCRCRPVMITCDAVALVALTSVPVVAWCGGLTLVQLYAVATSVGTAQVFFSTAYRALLPAVVADEHLDDANARLLAAESGATVAGPGVAGVLTQALGAVTGVLVDALSYLVSMLCLRGLHAPDTRPIAPRRPLREEIASGLRFLASDRLLRLFVTTGCLANLALAGVGEMTVPFLVRTVGTSSAAAGLLLAAGQVGGVVGAMLVPRLVRRWGSARALLVSGRSPRRSRCCCPLWGRRGAALLRRAQTGARGNRRRTAARRPAAARRPGPRSGTACAPCRLPSTISRRTPRSARSVLRPRMSTLVPPSTTVAAGSSRARHPARLGSGSRPASRHRLL